MNSIVTKLNNRYLIAIVTGMLVISFVRRFVGR